MNTGLDRRTVLRLSLAGLAGWCAIGASPVRAAERAGGPVAPVQALCDGLIAVMKAGRGTRFAARYKMLAPTVDTAFDLTTILRTSVGPRWSSLPAEQRAKLQEVFRRYTVATFVANFDSYDGQRITVSPQIRVSGNDQIVSTEIIPANGSPTQLDYVMRQENGEWKAVDVLAAGSISRVAVQRSDFRQLLADGTGQDLVASLAQKVATLSGGSLA